ncbi:MAG TPA: FAD-binding protein [Xanthomonadales bacterium]|nr:FAD-binding protein [Xanthomonadales bacterium]
MKRRQFLRSSAAAAATAAIPLTLLSQSAMAQAVAEMTQVKSDIEAVTGDGAEVTLERASVEELRGTLRGKLLLPDQAGYETARHVLNADINKYPAMIVQPTGAADVGSAIQFASERNLLVAVKCGGHSWAGKSTCNQGMQIDLSTYRGVQVDPASRRAFVAGGSLLGELDHEAMAHGLVTTAGTVSHTGVGGLTTGGGFGRLARRFGLALDNVRSVQVVTADGQLRTASETENPDLLWGVRGGGGNFGVVTRFEFQLHPMQREVIIGMGMWPLDQARDVLRHYGDSLASSPDDLYLDFVLMSEEGSSDGIAMIYACYSGDAEKANAILDPILSFGTPIQSNIQATDYVDEQKTWDSTDPRSNGSYLKSGFISELSDGLIDAIVDGFDPSPERTSQVFFQCSGGAISRIPVDSTAFAHRFALASVFTTASWPAGSERTPHVEYVREHWKAMEPYTRGWYVNEIANESQEMINANYEGNYPRLAQIKAEYDPTNLFRLNANIRPS